MCAHVEAPPHKRVHRVDPATTGIATLLYDMNTVLAQYKRLAHTANELRGRVDNWSFEQRLQLHDVAATVVGKVVTPDERDEARKELDEAQASIDAIRKSLADVESRIARRSLPVLREYDPSNTLTAVRHSLTALADNLDYVRNSMGVAKDLYDAAPAAMVENKIADRRETRTLLTDGASLYVRPCVGPYVLTLDRVEAAARIVGVAPDKAAAMLQLLRTHEVRLETPEEAPVTATDPYARDASDITLWLGRVESAAPPARP